MPNASLSRAFLTRMDEFYTTMDVVAEEMRHYRDQFRGKVIYCNCDDYLRSNFFKYFYDNFKELGLKKLHATHLCSINVPLFSSPPRAMHAEIRLSAEHYVPLRGSGCFSSQECTAILQDADIVITNPPFSHIKRYMRHLMYYKKKFLVMSALPALSTRQMIDYVKEGSMWLGKSRGAKWFHVPEEFIYPEIKTKIVDGKTAVALGNVVWLTNLPVKRKKLTLHKKYDAEQYSCYDNYDAINVDKVADIPADYRGKMGVPVSFLTYHAPEFSVLSFHGQEVGKARDYLVIDGELPFGRIIIQRK